MPFLPPHRAQIAQFLDLEISLLAFTRLCLIPESGIFPELSTPQGISPKFASTSEKVQVEPPTSICVISGRFPVVSYVLSVAPERSEICWPSSGFRQN